MRVEFASPDDEQKATLATAEWHDGAVTISSEDDELRTFHGQRLIRFR